MYDVKIYGKNPLRNRGRVLTMFDCTYIYIYLVVDINTIPEICKTHAWQWGYDSETITVKSWHWGTSKYAGYAY